MYVLYRDDHDMKLPYFIAIAGLACGLFAIAIPHLSALRVWLGFSTVFSLVYIIVGFALALKDGMPSSCFLVSNKYLIGVQFSLGFCIQCNLSTLRLLCLSLNGVIKCCNCIRSNFLLLSSVNIFRAFP